MWAFVKRFFLFGLVNALIVTTIYIVFAVVVSAFGLQAQVDQMPFWLPYYACIGFGGAFVSLAMSRQMAKWSLGVQLIDPGNAGAGERRLLETVYGLAQKAGLPAMPEVGVYNSPEVNAFATGPTKRRALVAVSTGLLNHMDAEAVEGVLGHEITHIANGDMVTMTLLQGLINTMVLIIARVLASVVASNVEERSRGAVRFIVFMLLQVVLSLLGSMVVCYFSRRREYRADAGGARVAGRERMLNGLKSLRDVYGHVDDTQQALATLKISGHSATAFARLFATHPPLEDRIRRLETMTI
jgi:heat shock protein HtpX